MYTYFKGPLNLTDSLKSNCPDTKRYKLTVTHYQKLRRKKALLTSIPQKTKSFKNSHKGKVN